jgi:HlyD family type I secretion membrane fusion protein
MSAQAASPALAPAANDPLLHAWQRDVRRSIVRGLLAIALALAALLAWAGWAPLAGAIVANGVVKVDTNRKTVQHRDGGIVREIRVREGEHVAAGQVLLVLDDARIDASFELLRSQLEAARLREARLAAEREGARSWPPAELRPSARDARAAEALAREAALFAARRSALEAQLRLVRQQQQAVAVEAGAREREHASVSAALASMQEEVGLNRALLAQQFVNRTRVMQLERNAAEYQSRLDANRAELAQARQRGADLELRASTLRDTFQQDAAAELRDALAKRVEIEEQLSSARDAAERKLVVAPVAGRVLELRVTTAGGAIGPRDPILDIVPDDSPLLVEARVTVDAIAELHAGLPADVRLTAFRQRTTPLVGGRVVYVSPDALTDRQSGAAYYLLHVALDPASLERAGALVLQPGMGAEVFVRTEERSALEFLVEPLVNAARRSLREH